MSLLPVIISGGLQQCRCTPHPTLHEKHRVMIVDKFDAKGEHELSRALPVKCVDGSEIWVLSFTKFEEENDYHRFKIIHEWPTPVSKENLKAYLERTKEGGAWLSPSNAYLCQCVGLVDEVAEASNVIREKNRIRSLEREKEDKARAEREAIQRAEREKIQAAAYAKAKEDFTKGEMISTVHFEDMCKEYQVPMHLRTIGTLRKSVQAIGIGMIQHVRGTDMAGIRLATRCLREAMQPPEPVDPEVEKLFTLTRS